MQLSLVDIQLVSKNSKYERNENIITHNTFFTYDISFKNHNLKIKKTRSRYICDNSQSTFKKILITMKGDYDKICTLDISNNVNKVYKLFSYENINIKNVCNSNNVEIYINNKKYEIKNTKILKYVAIIKLSKYSYIILLSSYHDIIAVCINFKIAI
jgi:hypothetical protein